MAIQSFAHRDVELFFRAGRVSRRAGWGAVRRIAARKLDMLDYAHALKGDLRGFHSIRINDQWRVVFRWTTGGPCDVDIRDYH